MTSVYIVDDSAVARAHLKHILESDPEIRIAGEACSGEEAVEFVRTSRPDVITMDISMPRMDGHEATSRIMETNPVPIVIVSANYNKDQVGQSFRAMEAGALAIVEKPSGIGHADYERSAGELIKTVKLMSEVRVVRRWRKTRPLPLAPREPLRETRNIKAVLIGASTGGPPVLQTVLAGFHTGFPAPILVVQHITNGFIEGMLEWLGAAISLPVALAKDGERALAGHVYFAPDDHHMGIDASGRLCLSAGAPENGIRPSVSHLFRSAIESYGGEVVAVLLTGMGRDGADEMKKIRDLGGVTIIQDKESSVVYGMPGEAARLGGAAYVLTPERIPSKIEGVVRWREKA
ncbi:MAG: chemotaxis-specific protein-glutamate methyltransferase CheB [Deltaproteobacteria bacterium]|nr:chemotaxis-specific protein-glutamate methyltransferase CheB [Deltaproteobacteria bacterium]